MSRSWRRTVCILTLSALLGLSVPALADFWDDVGTVGRGIAAVATAGWSELVLELIDQIKGVKKTIEKQLDEAADKAMSAVLTTVRVQSEVVASAEGRMNADVARAQQAVHTYSAHYMDGRKVESSVVGKVVAPSSQVAKATGSSGFVTKSAATPTPAPSLSSDLDLIRSAETWLETRGKEFPALASDIRKGLDLGPVGATAKITSIRADAAKDVFGPLDLMLMELGTAVMFPPTAVAMTASHLWMIQTRWAEELAGIDTSVTGAADEKIRAANPARATAAADWADRFANVIEAATGKQNVSGLTPEQAKEQIRRELGLPRTSILVLVGASKTTALVRASGGVSKVQPKDAADQAFAGARTAAQRLDERRQSLARSVDSYLESQFRGKSGPQLDAARQDLLRQARQRFAGDPRVLAAVENIINQRAAGQPIGVNTLAAIAGRAAR